jgi:hypothetical protein
MTTLHFQLSIFNSPQGRVVRGRVVIARAEPEAIQTRGVPPGLLRFARNDGGVGRNDAGTIVIANPQGEAIQTEKAVTLDCRARSTERLARNDGR